MQYSGGLTLSTVQAVQYCGGLISVQCRLCSTMVGEINKYQFRISFLLPGIVLKHFLKAGWPVVKRDTYYEGGYINVCGVFLLRFKVCFSPIF